MVEMAMKPKGDEGFPPTWFVYILRCADRSYYTGITTNLTRRVAEHNGAVAGSDSSTKLKRGARYTRSRRPLELVYAEPCMDRSAALKREYAIKRLSRSKKAELVNIRV